MVIVQKTSSWWKYLLTFLGGMLFGFAVVAGAVGIAGGAVPIKNYFGQYADLYIQPKYQNNTAFQLIFDLANKKIPLETLGDIYDLTPLVDDFIRDRINPTLKKELGFEFDLDEMHGVAINNLENYIVTTLKNGITLAGALKVNENSDPVLVYLCYPKADPTWYGAKYANGVYAKDTNTDIVLDNGTYTIDFCEDYNNNYSIIVNKISDQYDPTHYEIDKPEEGSFASKYRIAYGDEDEETRNWSKSLIGEEIEPTEDSGYSNQLRFYVSVEEYESFKFMVRNKDGGYLFDQAYPISQFMDNPAFISDKINNMTIGDAVIPDPDSPLAAISDKTMGELKHAGALDDVEIASLLSEEQIESSKIIQTLADRGTTVGEMSDAINDLKVGDVFEYNEDELYSLPPVLKTLICESNESWPGAQVIQDQTGSYFHTFTIHEEYDELSDNNLMVHKTRGYNKFFITDGKNNRSLRLMHEDYWMYEGVNVYYDYNLDQYVVEGYGSSTFDPRTSNQFTLNINVPTDWEKVYVFEYDESRGTSVKNIDERVKDLTIKDVINFDESSPLWKVKDCKVDDGDELFETMKERFTLEDIFTDEQIESNKFLKNLPKDTTINKIADELNNLKVLDVFEEEMYDENGYLKGDWKYLLIEEGEPDLQFTHKDDDPFNYKNTRPGDYVYACAAYKVNDSMDDMIDNLNWHMQNESLKRLHDDGIITMEQDETGGYFIDKEIPQNIQDLLPWDPVTQTGINWEEKKDSEGKVLYGALTVNEFVKLMEKVVDAFNPPNP